MHIFTSHALLLFEQNELSSCEGPQCTKRHLPEVTSFVVSPNEQSFIALGRREVWLFQQHHHQWKQKFLPYVATEAHWLTDRVILLRTIHHWMVYHIYNALEMNVLPLGDDDTAAITTSETFGVGDTYYWLHQHSTVRRKHLAHVRVITPHALFTPTTCFDKRTGSTSPLTIPWDEWVFTTGDYWVWLRQGKFVVTKGVEGDESWTLEAVGCWVESVPDTTHLVRVVDHLREVVSLRRSSDGSLVYRYAEEDEAPKAIAQKRLWSADGSFITF